MARTNSGGASTINGFVGCEPCLLTAELRRVRRRVTQRKMLCATLRLPLRNSAVKQNQVNSGTPRSAQRKYSA